MSKRNPGGLISTTGLREPSATDQSQNSGVWTLEEQYQADANGTWANPSGQVYEITNSLRFRAANSAYLNRTPSVAGNRKTWTWSGWVKRGQVSNSTFRIFGTGDNTSATNQTSLNFATNFIEFYNQPNNAFRRTTAVYRDPSAWYHIIIVWDSNNIAANDRIRLYVNGQQVTTFSSSTNPSSGDDTFVNSTISHTIGTLPTNAGNYFDGYVAEVNFVDGQALDPSYFGYTDYNGVWQPKRYTGVFGTNGFYLPFNPQAYGDSITTTTLGFDKSGNSNNWTSNNFSVTAGATYDLMKDSPTNGSIVEDTGLGGQLSGNYATLNPLNTDSSITILNAGLNYSWTGNSNKDCFSNFPVRTGKYYIETMQTTSNPADIVSGFSLTSYNRNTVNLVGDSSSQYLGYTYAGRKWDKAVQTNGLTTLTVGTDVLCFAIDLDAGKAWAGKNGVWFASGDPSTGANPFWTFPANSEYVYASPIYNATGWVNFGQRPFAYAAPAGFKCLNTANLPMTTIPDSKKYFDVSLWRGDGTSPRTVVSSLNFDPDFVWVKSRSNSSWWHHLSNKVAGIGNNLFTNNTDAELAQGSNIAGFISSTSATGFTVTAGSSSIGSYNANNDTYVAWQWKAGDTTVTNTAGSITTQVRANPTAGFSIFTYTGTGGTATVGHGLGSVPRFIIIKERTPNTDNWNVYHTSIGASGWLQLNTTNEVLTGSDMWNSTAPTSSVVTIRNPGAGGYSNRSGANYVAYCWSEVPGYSNFGSYVGNASTDGPFIYTGFRPKYVLIKRSTGSSDLGNWILFDTTRDPYNVANNQIFPNSSAAENGLGGDGDNIDILSNGFKIRGSGGWVNQSGSTIVYICFAEHPFKTSRAR
jgi:hypothetical protein